jgi:N utilization substance protein A
VLQSIEGFDEDLAVALKERAQNYIDNQNIDIISKLETLGVEQELIDILDVTPDSLLRLAEYGVKTIEDLGELSVEEFKALVPNTNLNNSAIAELIKSAREGEEK